MTFQPGEVHKLGDRVTRVSASFDAAPPRVFAALTQPAQLSRWMSASGFTLEKAEVDGRAGGGFRYVYARPSGKLIEVRGTYRSYDPSRGYSYVESYDFSPLTIDVDVALEPDGGGTRYTQTLRYASAAERDEDYEGVASSTREALAKLARYLAAESARRH